MTSKKPSLDELIFGALSQLQMLDYNARSIRRYQATWTRLIKFAKQNNIENRLTKKLIIAFLKHSRIEEEKSVNANNGWRKHAEYSLKILWQFSQYGYFERIHTLIKKLNIPSKMEKILEAYATYCKEKRHISEYCYYERIRQIGLLLDFIGKDKIKSFEQIEPQHLSDFIVSLWRFSQRTKSRVVSDIRQFFRYLFLKNLIKQDISKTLPSIHVAQDAKIPSVWDKALLDRLLNTIDRSLPRGRRDYAIILLACRLGLRIGDIRKLTLDEIHWDTETLRFIQSKTQRPITLPLTEEVGQALIDYIQYDRPQTHYRQVFLRLRPPFHPFSKNSHLSYILSYWRELAQIKFKSKQQQSLGSLRHSLATYLLEEGTPFPVISTILGHASSTSTMIYAKSSVEMLREVALSLKEIDDV